MTNHWDDQLTEPDVQLGIRDVFFPFFVYNLLTADGNDAGTETPLTVSNVWTAVSLTELDLDTNYEIPFVNLAANWAHLHVVINPIATAADPATIAVYASVDSTTPGSGGALYNSIDPGVLLPAPRPCYHCDIYRIDNYVYLMTAGRVVHFAEEADFGDKLDLNLAREGGGDEGYDLEARWALISVNG